VIEPEQQQIAGPPAGDTDGERPVHLATADASSNPHDFTLQLQQARIELPS
jgi:hypothetical protein